MLEGVVNVKKAAGELTEYWSPKVVAELDDSYVKVAKLLGSFTWHNHENEDELFFVIEGSLTIEMEDRMVRIGEGDVYVVKKGVMHNPIAESECLIMLIEKKQTLHTGSVISEKTKSIEEQLTIISKLQS